MHRWPNISFLAVWVHATRTSKVVVIGMLLDISIVTAVHVEGKIFPTCKSHFYSKALHNAAQWPALVWNSELSAVALPAWKEFLSTALLLDGGRNAKACWATSQKHGWAFEAPLPLKGRKVLRKNGLPEGSLEDLMGCTTSPEKGRKWKPELLTLVGQKGVGAQPETQVTETSSILPSV